MGFLTVGVIGHSLLPDQVEYVRAELERVTELLPERLEERVIYQVGLNPGAEIVAANILLDKQLPLTAMAAGPWMTELFDGKTATQWRRLTRRVQDEGNDIVYQSRALPRDISAEGRQRLYTLSLLRRNQAFASICDMGIIISIVLEAITQNAFGAFLQEGKPIYHIDPQKQESKWVNVPAEEEEL